jgi:hypothetical protein
MLPHRYRKTILFGWKEEGRSILMEGGRTFDIDSFLEFMPAQEGKGVKNYDCRQSMLEPIKRFP